MNHLPICRAYVNCGFCKYQDKCKFYHPQIITKIIKRKAQRELGYCFCGAPQKCIMYKNTLDITFYMVCSRTGKSMKRCI